MSRYIDADKFYTSQAARCWGEPIIGTCTSDNALLYDEFLMLLKLYGARIVDITNFSQNPMNVSAMSLVDMLSKTIFVAEQKRKVSKNDK